MIQEGFEATLQEGIPHLFELRQDQREESFLTEEGETGARFVVVESDQFVDRGSRSGIGSVDSTTYESSFQSVSVSLLTKEDQIKKDGKRTNDEGEFVSLITRINEHAPNLPILVNPLPSHIPINIIRPLEPNSDILIPLFRPNRLDDSEAKEVLEKDDLARLGERETKDERELETACGGDPGIGTATAACDLVRGEAG